MAFDRTTETIAHFVGLFSLAVEKMVLREQYEKFQASKNADDELEAIDAPSFRINSDHRLKDYDPDVNYRPPDGALMSPQPSAEGEVVIPPPNVSNEPFEGPSGGEDVLTQPSDGSGFNASFVLPLPSSVVAVTIQFNQLDDNDSFGVTEQDTFVPPVYFDAMVAQVVEIAESLQGIATPVLPANEDGWQPFAVETLDQIQAAVTADQPVDANVSVDVQSGDETTGITIDGEVGDEVPVLADLLPEFLQVDEETQDIGGDDDDTASDDDGMAADGDDSPSDDGDIASDEDEIDASALLSEDVDASVSTQDGVAGDNNSGSDDAETSTQDNTTHEDETTTHQTETTDVDTQQRFDEAFEDGRPDSPSEVEDGHLVVAGANTQLNETQLSSNWLDAEVIAVQGDVYEIEVISQVNVSVGADVINGQLSDATSTALNIVEIVETSSEALAEEDVSEEAIDAAEPEPQLYTGLPSNAVVVHAQGNVTQINWTVQESYLNDNDTAIVTIAASATYIGLGDNDEFNQTFLTQSGFNYDLIFVGGDLTDVTVITQTNVLLDGGNIDVGALVNVDSGDNLQVNLAQLNTVGIDTHVDLDEGFQQDLGALQGGAENVSDEVASDDLFEGIELLRVLYIEGDLTTVNVAIQNNVLGDVEQLDVAHAAVEAAQNLEGLAEQITADVDAEVQVITGSNAQANVAVLNDFGIDSTVMTGGEVYSDALIYQAELIDTAAIPTGVELSALSNDAIAILVQDTLDIGNIAEDIIATTSTATADLPGAADIMQSVLA